MPRLSAPTDRRANFLPASVAPACRTPSPGLATGPADGTLNSTMRQTRFSEDIRSITDLKVRAAAIVDRVRRSKRPTLLTRRGRGIAVVVDLEEYERLVDR